MYVLLPEGGYGMVERHGAVQIDVASLPKGTAAGRCALAKANKVSIDSGATGNVGGAIQGAVARLSSRPSADRS